MNSDLPQKTLGPVSAAFLSAMFDRGKVIFTLEEAEQTYGKSRKQTSDFLKALVKRQVLTRIKSEVYLIMQMGQENAQLTNWPIIARELVGPGDDYCISHYSAMRHHGMTTHALNEVLITRPKKQRDKTISGIHYRFVYSKPENFWGGAFYWVTQHERVKFTDIERTLLDGLARPELCGGVKEVVRGLWVKQNHIDWQKLIAYSQKFHSKAAVKRLGFILSLLDLNKRCLAELNEIIIDAKDYILLDPNGLKKGGYVAEWRVRINIDVEELKASVWT